MAGEDGILILLISHKVAASFLAETETETSLVFLCGEFLQNSAPGIANDDGDLVPVFHVGTGVVDPALIPTKIARLNLYFCTKDDEEDDEPSRFRILHTLLLFPSKLWFFHDISVFSQ